MIILVLAGLFAIAIAGSKPLTEKQIEEANEKQFKGMRSTDINAVKLITLLMLR